MADTLKDKIADRIIQRIGGDIADRSGIGEEWCATTNETINDSIIPAWREIINSELLAFLSAETLPLVAQYKETEPYITNELSWKTGKNEGSISQRDADQILYNAKCEEVNALKATIENGSHILACVNKDYKTLSKSWDALKAENEQLSRITDAVNKSNGKG